MDARGTLGRLGRGLATLVVVASAMVPRLAVAEPAAHESEEAHRPKLTKPPALTHFVEAAYPETEKAAGKSAAVVLGIAIGATGAVEEVTVLQSAGRAFDDAAAAVAKQFTFSPAELDGKPAPVRIQYRYEFVLKQELPVDATFDGVVQVRGAGTPLGGVTVELDDGRKAVTDDQGKFNFDKIAPGSHRVALSRTDLKAMQTEESFEAGKRLDAVYEIETAPPETAATADSDDLEIVVIAPKLTKQTVSTVVDADQAKRVAGTQGDVLKVVENMPGVARATAGSGAVVVWGAAAADTRVYVDGVRVPMLYHFGGLRSVVHTDLVSSVELVPGGYGAAYGRGLGGLITVEKKAPAEDRLHGSAQIDFLDASAAVSGPIADKWRIEGAVRRSHLDWVLDRVTSEDVGAFFPIPKYYDGQLSVRYQAAPNEWIDVGGMLSSDSLARNVTSPDPDQRKSETQEESFNRVYARYVKRPGNGSEITLVPWAGQEHSSSLANFGGTATALDVRSMNYGLRAAYRGPLASFLSVAVGLDLEATSATAHREGSVASPPREGDPVIFGQPPSDQVSTDDWNAVIASAAPYAEGDFSVFADRLHIVPGIRVEPFLTSVSRRTPAVGDTPGVGAFIGDVAVQPRLSVRYAMSDRVTFKAAYGKYRQPSAVDDLSPSVGNPLLSPASATHWLGGAAVRLTSLISAETTLFYSLSDGLAVRSSDTSPLVGQSLVGDGSGRSYGAQVLLRRELSNGLFGWIAYTLLRSERQDAPNGEWRLSDFDQTHVLTALASYSLGEGFDVGARFRYATGFPRTPVVGSYYDSRRNLYEPILGATNSERIPAFLQLDVRLAKVWKLGSTELEAYADVQNVTNRPNDEEIVYSADYSQKRYIHGLPILPILGARWSF